MTTIYVTSYALTTGVVKMEAEIKESGYASGSNWREGYGKKHYVLTEADAIDRFERMRLKKIDSLTRQLKKLEGMKFKIKEPK